MSEWFKWFPWLCYSQSKDAVHCLPCILFGHKFPEKASPVKNIFIPNLLDIGQKHSQSVKYMLSGRKRRTKVLMSHANHCIVKHGLFFVTLWLI